VLSIPEVKETDELEGAVDEEILTNEPPALAVSKPLAFELNLIAVLAEGVTLKLLNFNLLRAITL
jgi:hypothetical protein